MFSSYTQHLVVHFYLTVIDFIQTKFGLGNKPSRILTDIQYCTDPIHAPCIIVQVILALSIIIQVIIHYFRSNTFYFHIIIDFTN